jgi:hypothetical protein
MSVVGLGRAKIQGAIALALCESYHTARARFDGSIENSIFHIFSL